MKNFFLIIAFASVLQSCFTTKRTPPSNNQLGATAKEQMYPGHSMLKPEEVPQDVVAAWSKEHSGVSGAEWYKEDSNFIVYYLNKKLQSRIFYNANGKEIARSREVKSDDVPVAIRDYMKVKYPGIQYGRTYLTYRVDEASNKYYEVQVDDNTWERFDSNGKQIDKK